MYHNFDLYIIIGIPSPGSLPIHNKVINLKIKLDIVCILPYLVEMKRYLISKLCSLADKSLIFSWHEPPEPCEQVKGKHSKVGFGLP